MIDLTNQKISYIVISSEKIDDIMSVLYAKNYQIIPLKGYYQGQYEDSLIAFGVDNDELRKDLIFLLNHFRVDSGVVKYFGEIDAKKVNKDGSERPLSIVLYNTDSDNISYLYDGISFSFVEKARYWKPKKEEDFSTGMLVEYMNNNKWYTKEVVNVSEEYHKLYNKELKETTSSV